MAYPNLRFFDSESNDLNLLYNSDTNIWEGVCYLPIVSTGLYETLTIYILEQVQGLLGNDQYITPIATMLGETQFKFKFFNGYEFSKDIFMYSASNNNGRLEITKDNIQVHPILPPDPAYFEGEVNGIKKIKTNMSMIPIKCNIALMSHDDNYHTGILDIFEVNNGNEILIASIRIYGETESEDERLTVLLSNIGMSMSEDEYMILKDSNIMEFAPDWILMNQKRKELLLQASEIKPFIGTYKALLNAIDFYGYNNLTLKEYWLNINEQSENFGKLLAVAIPNQDTVGFLANKNNNNELPNSNIKKTSRFSIVYRLNEADGGVDSWDIPTVKESSDYSPDEVIIKLYGLKKKLQSTYLPLNAKIVDITGEGDYFSQFNMKVWNNQHIIKDQTAGSNVDFSRYPIEKQLYIEDLRKVDYRLTGRSQNFANLSDTEREEISSSIINFYDSYYNTELSSFNTLRGIPIGCPIVLNAKSFIDTWDDAEFTFIDGESTGNHMLEWDNWWKQGIYEMEWIVKGPRDYFKSFRGNVGYWAEPTTGNQIWHPGYQQFPIVLPYSGVYSVELAVYDLYNVRSYYRIPNYFEVKNKNVEVYGLLQKMSPKLSWNEYTYSYDVSGSEWEWSRENIATIDSIIATYYLTLDRANYVHDDVDSPEFSTVRRYLDSASPFGFSETPGPYQWKELRNHVWDDGTEVNWNMMRVGGDIHSSFKMDLRQDTGHVNGHVLEIEQIDPNTNLEIVDTYIIQSTYPINKYDIQGWTLIAEELSSLDPNAHPLLSKFNYNPILVDSDNNESTGTGPIGEDMCEYILVVAESPSRTHDYSSVKFDSVLGGTILQDSEIHFTIYNPSFHDIHVIDTHIEVHMLNHVTFSYDISNMPGIIGCKWTLKNNSKKIDDIYSNNTWLTYLFKHKGDYTIELELTDVNGNRNKINKNILKIV